MAKVKYILENPVGDLDLTFSQEVRGEGGPGDVRTVELVPGGALKAVTDENKAQYVVSLANFLLATRVEKQVRDCTAQWANKWTQDQKKIFLKNSRK